MSLLSESFINIRSIQSVVFHYLNQFQPYQNYQNSTIADLYNQPVLGSQLLKGLLRNKKETVRRVLSGNVCSKGGSTFSFCKCSLP